MKKKQLTTEKRLGVQLYLVLFLYTVTGIGLEVGAKVEGKIDWVHRFDLMQQHSGEHMVSGIIHEKYGYDNVGFHMGSDVITVDLNGMLDDSQLAEIEREVNERVWEDREVVITYPDAEELKTIDYRSKKELTGRGGLS